MKREKKTQIYKKVAEELKLANDFVTAQEIAQKLGLTKEQVRRSVSAAKNLLAVQGLMVINEVGRGYKLGTVEEFTFEATKSCLRAIAHLGSMQKRLRRLLYAEVSPLEINLLLTVIQENLQRLVVSEPTFSKESSGAIERKLRLTAEFIKREPFKEV